MMDEAKLETLDLSRRGLKKIEKAPEDESKTIINLILDHNELQRLDNIDTYTRVENLSICNNFLLRMHGVSRLTNLRVLALNSNGILQIEGLKDMTYLKVLKLAGNNIKSIEHLNNNIHLEHLDLSNNQISFIADISYLKNLKHLSLERNRVGDLRQCERYLPPGLRHLGLAHNALRDLPELAHLQPLAALEAVTLQGNPALTMSPKDKLGFDYRPYVLNWIMSVKTIDGFLVTAIESLKAEWLYSQGKGRHFQPGQHRELCEYLAATCPLTADAPETEDQRKLRLILTKAQHHQQQLKEQTHSPVQSRLQSPRMQSRISRHVTRSPDRLSSSYHAALGKSSPGGQLSHGDLEPIPRCMSQSYDAPGLRSPDRARGAPDVQPKQNQALEAASKMVPVPESLMSPDYQEPLYSLQLRPGASQPAASQPAASQPAASQPGASQPAARHIVQPGSVSRGMRSSPKPSRSATNSPKLRSKMEQRKGSLTKMEPSKPEKCKSLINGRLNGMKHEDQPDSGQSETGRAANDQSEAGRAASNQRRQKKASVEALAAVTIQKMWRGYRSRNLNKDTLRILHAIQAARARQHIQRLTCDMEATKAALDSERKIQQLQMQAINALWKKVSTLQATDGHRNKSEADDNARALRQLTDTCLLLQVQVAELQGSMQQVLRAVSSASPAAAPVATQTDVVAVATPHEERCSWLRRPQSLALAAASAPAAPAPAPPPLEEPRREPKNPPQMENMDIERTESITEDTYPDTQSVADSDLALDKDNIIDEKERSIIVD